MVSQMKHTEAFLDTYEARKTEEDPFALGFELLLLALADILLKDSKEVNAA